MHKHTHKMLSVATVQSTAWLETPTLTCTQHLTKIKSLTHHWAPCEWMNLFFLCVEVCVCVCFCIEFKPLLNQIVSCPPARLPLHSISTHGVDIHVEISATINFWENVSIKRTTELSRMTGCLFIHTLHFTELPFQRKTIPELGFKFFFSFFVNKAPQNHMRTYHLCDDMRSVVCYVRTQLLYKERLKAFFL